MGRTLVWLVLWLGADAAWAQKLGQKSVQQSAQNSAQKSTLDALITEVWEHELRAQPEQATGLGDDRYNDQLSDGSWASLSALATARRGYLARLAAIAVAGLGPDDRLNHALLGRMLTRAVRQHELGLDLLPIDQMQGIHHAPLGWMRAMPFRTVKDYENYVARLGRLPVAFEQAIERARRGAREHLVPPAYLMDKVVAEVGPLAVTGGEHPMAEPIRAFPDGISAADQARLRAAVNGAIRAQVVPAYQAYLRFVRQEYTAACRADVAFSSLPGGNELYRFLVADHTTTTLTPDQIHAIGVQEVAGLEAEMTALAKRQGHADLPSWQRVLRSDRRVFASSREQIVDRYRQHLAWIGDKVPLLFGRLPRASLVVAPVEPFREAAAAGAMYEVSSPDGRRPGRVVVNTREPERQPLYPIEATAYHEGLPGHHLQMALARELPGLPAFRRHAEFAAFQEGWALYAEGLGKEVGGFADPVSDYGRLTSEMIRAVRLVVDTGLHARGWTRERALAYFQAHSTMDAAYIAAEVDRYIAMPAQALAYKIGQRKLRELRQRAEAALGAKFDRRAFHDQLLRHGEIPLDVLEQELATWLAAQPR